jgi:hypothetical protein
MCVMSPAESTQKNAAKSQGAGPWIDRSNAGRIASAGRPSEQSWRMCAAAAVCFIGRPLMRAGSSDASRPTAGPCFTTCAP